MKKEKVLVAMSGGLDSSVVCLILQQQGYEVYGVTLKIWDPDDLPPGCRHLSIGGDQEIDDAREVAQKLNIPHYVIDVREKFANTVIQNFIDEYMRGRTPNPCTYCNRVIKWDAVIQKADVLGCSYIATGHYAHIVTENSRCFVRKGDDPLKEQSYMLWQLGQDVLKRTLFPLAEMSKKQARELANHYGLSKVASKGESFDVCFIADKDYRLYLKRKVDGIANRFHNGNFVDKEGRFLGHHEGYMFFTIGQRKGLPAMGYRAYVNEIRPDTNEVVIGKEDELFKKEIIIDNINALKYERIPENKELIIKLRYHHAGERGHFSYMEDGKGLVTFIEPVQSPTPGQSAVFYEKNDLLGGGIIVSVS